MATLIEFLVITVKNIPSDSKTIYGRRVLGKKKTYLRPRREEFFQEVKLIQQIKNTGNIKFYRDVKDKHVVAVITARRRHSPMRGQGPLSV
jgi:hypothetical protein